MSVFRDQTEFEVWLAEVERLLDKNEERVGQPLSERVSRGPLIILQLRGVTPQEFVEALQAFGFYT